MSFIGKYLATHAIAGKDGTLEVCCADFKGSYTALSHVAQSMGIRLT